MDRSVGALLRQHLDAKQMSQVEAAPLLGCSAKHLNQVLMGRKMVSVEMAAGFEKLCGWPGLAEQVLMMQVRAQLRELGLGVQHLG